MYFMLIKYAGIVGERSYLDICTSNMAVLGWRIQEVLPRLPKVDFTKVRLRADLHDN